MICWLRNTKDENVYKEIDKQQKERKCFMDKNNDLRVVKTKRLLKEALLTLLREIEFEEITIMKLTKQAQINRSTFYAHFYDKFDLLEKTINDELVSFVEEVAPKSEEELTLTEIPNPFYLR